MTASPLVIPTRDRRPRNGPVRLVVVHVNVGPEYQRAAIDIAKFTQHEQGGYHEIVDDRQVVVTANDNEVVNGAGGVNEIGWHICLIGQAFQSARDWSDSYSTAELDLAAQRTRAACQRLNVPVRHIDGQAILRGDSGICGHADVSTVYSASQGHWDPGPNFPWPHFLALVGGQTPPPPPSPEDDVQLVLLQPKTVLTSGDLAGKKPTVVAIRGTPMAFHINSTQLLAYERAHVPLQVVDPAFFNTLAIHLLPGD